MKLGHFSGHPVVYFCFHSDDVIRKLAGAEQTIAVSYLAFSKYMWKLLSRFTRIFKDF